MRKLIILLCLLPLLSYGQFDGNGEFTAKKITADTIAVTSILDVYDCTSYSAGTDYQAAKDGFVVAYNDLLDIESGEYLSGYTDVGNPASILVAKCGGQSAVTGEIASCTITFPVRAGDYWRVDAAVTSICFISLK